LKSEDEIVVDHGVKGVEKGVSIIEGLKVGHGVKGRVEVKTLR
jgi:hypothetical protein